MSIFSKSSVYFFLIIIFSLLAGFYVLAAPVNYELECQEFCNCCDSSGDKLSDIEIQKLPSDIQEICRQVIRGANLVSGETLHYCALPRGTSCFCNLVPSPSIEELLKSIISKITIVLLLLASTMIVIGGFILMTSAGSESRMQRGKNIIKWSLIGLGVLLLSRLSVSLVQKILTQP